MPYVDNNGIRIHYHVKGEGPPLVLVAGPTSTVDTWYDLGYGQELEEDYRLILLDVRGNGKSDKPHDPKEYDMRLRVGDVLAILDDLGIDRTHYFGASMGGRIGWGMAKYAPEWVHSLIIGAMSPYGPDEAAKDRLRRDAEILRQGPEAALAEAEAVYGVLIPEHRARILAADCEAMWANRVASVDWQGVADILPTMTMPCLVFAGEADDNWAAGVAEGVKHMPNVTYVSLPGLNHVESITRIDLVLPHVTKFLTTVSREAVTHS